MDRFKIVKRGARRSISHTSLWTASIAVNEAGKYRIITRLVQEGYLSHTSMEKATLQEAQEAFNRFLELANPQQSLF